MYGVMRRISSGFIPRSDRPWQEDATSNAPSVGRKRRRSTTEQDIDDPMDDQSTPKKARGDTPAEPDRATTSSTPVPQPETEALKEVTKGVKKVELEDKKEKEKEKEGETNSKEGEEGGESQKLEETEEEGKEKVTVAPESVPLPEEVSGELDESASIRSTPPAEEAEAEANETEATLAKSSVDTVSSNDETTATAESETEDSKET